MMAAPPSRSHFGSQQLHTSTCSDKNNDMDGSLRVSSASTETTAGSTLAAEGLQIDTSSNHSSNSQTEIPPELIDTTVTTSNDMEKQQSKSISAETTPVSIVAPDLKKPPPSEASNAATIGMSASFSQITHTCSLPEYSALLYSVLPDLAAGVARMPTEAEDPHIDPELLKVAQQIQNESEPLTPLQDDSEQDKKPAARPRTNSPKPSLVTKRSPSKSPKNSVTFAALPEGTGVAPDILQDQKPPAKPTTATTTVLARPTALTNGQRSKSAPTDVPADAATATDVPTPRARAGGRGLRGRRQPQTAQDRDNRRRQILQRTCSEASDTSSSNNDNSTSGQRSPISIPPSAPPSMEPPNMEPIAMMQGSPRTPQTPNNNNNNTAARTAPGDDLALPPAAAPGDNLATGSPTVQRPTTRRIVRPLTPTNKVANPSPTAYATAPMPSPMPHNVAEAGAATDQTVADHSSKQRARREGQNSTPDSTIKPGAYKEIPGRGLVRNNTLRFSIMSSIQNKKRSLRKMFSSRRNTFGARDLSSTDQSNSRGLGEINESNGDLQRTTSVRSLRSVPSFLVDEDRQESRSYLGTVSFRSLAGAAEGGLSVARPVFTREASTLEALCIIPGDLAVAVALDEQIKETCQSDSQARLEALSSGRPPSLKKPPPQSHNKRSKPRRTRRMVASVVTKHIKLLKTVPEKLHPKNLNPKNLNPKNLNPFRRRPRAPRRHRSAYAGSKPDMTELNKTASIAKLPPLPERGGGGGRAMRRHSF